MRRVTVQPDIIGWHRRRFFMSTDLDVTDLGGFLWISTGKVAQSKSHLPRPRLAGRKPEPDQEGDCPRTPAPETGAGDVRDRQSDRLAKSHHPGLHQRKRDEEDGPSR